MLATSHGSFVRYGGGTQHMLLFTAATDAICYGAVYIAWESLRAEAAKLGKDISPLSQ